MGRREGELDPAAGSVQRFAFELRKLRQEAGALTYRVMAQRTGYSVATLSRAASGERLPSLPVALAYVRACGADPAEWEQRWHAAAEEKAVEPRHGGGARAPYRGLARFEPGDRDLFFGREQLVAQLVERVQDHRVVAVVGASGSGKSSLLRAGLIPALQQEGTPDHRPTALRILTPGPHPLSTHAGLMTAAQGTGDTVVVVDQLEELFTLCADLGERAAFLDLLVQAADPGRRLRVIIAVRADFFGRCAEHHALAAQLRDATVLVGPMSPAEYRQAIVKPATATGLIVERELTARIIEDVSDTPGGLPLMSHALLETWRRRTGRALTLPAYRAAGGIQGAIARTAEDLYTQLSVRQADCARRILLRLIAPGEGTPDTRRPASRSELDLADAPVEVPLVLDRLARARLVILDEDTVDLAHEALITGWPRLRDWIERDRERLRVHRRLTEAAEAWADLGKDPGALYRGSRLTTAEEQLAPPELTPVEQAFLHAGIAQRTQEQHLAGRTVRRLRRLRAALSVAAVLALIAGVVAWQRDQDGEQRLAEATSRRVASAAESMRYSDPLTAMRLSVAAWRISPTLEARAALMGAMTQREQDAFAEPGARTADHRQLSFDGRTMVSGGSGRVRVWDLDTQQQNGTARIKRRQELFDASSDNRRLLLFSHAGWELLDLTSGASTRLPASLTDVGVTFGPNTHTLSLWSDNRRTGLWDLRRHRKLSRSETEEALRSADPPDDRRRAVCTDSGELEVVNGRETRRLRATGRWASVVRLACGPRDRADANTSGGLSVPVFLLHPSRDILMIVLHDRIRTWNLATRKELPSVPKSGPHHVTPDGQFLITADDRDIRVRRVSDLAEPIYHYPLKGRSVTEVRLYPDRRMIRYIERQTASASVTRTLHLGDAVDPGWRSLAHKKTAPQRHGSDRFSGGWLTSVAIGPDTVDRVATGDETGWVTLWDRAVERRLSMFAAAPADDVGDGGPRPISALAYSPDGRILAVAAGATVQLWDTASTQPLGGGLLTTGDTTTSLTFSDDGRSLTVRGTHTRPHTYPVEPSLVAKAVCERSRGGVSAADWQTYVPEVPYRKTC
ncbi:helix-turn-helix domain-containing protein [Streptomyces sp. NPDC051214]|uniref:nSTAND1 domain-containing NTPase n=1 Tax=Streptomyces sp. NPDC051214 TaxID=3155282 RepID=UPI00341354FB